MCSSSHSSFSRTSTITASALFDFAAASCGEISVILFFASATSFSKPDGIASNFAAEDSGRYSKDWPTKQTKKHELSE